MDEKGLKWKAINLALKRGGEVHFSADSALEARPEASEPGGPRAAAAEPQVSSIKGATLTEEVRGVLAIWAVSLMTVLLLVPLIAFTIGRVSITDLGSIFQAVFTGTAGIIGAVLGFYFSSQQAKSSASSAGQPKPSGRKPQGPD